MKIAVLPGDGIGKEVTAQAVRVLEATLGNAVSYELKEGANWRSRSTGRWRCVAAGNPETGESF